MKNKITVSLVFILPLLIYFILLSLNPDNAVEQAALAKGENPQVIVFSTPMCGECKKLHPVIEEAQKKYSDKIDIIKINAVDNKNSTNRLIREHRVYLVPTIIYKDKTGSVVNRTEGSMSYYEFEQYLKDLLEK